MSGKPRMKGRGSTIAPANRFEQTHREDDFEQLAPDEPVAGDTNLPTQYLPDDSQTIVVENDSPDIGFRYSVNCYRGCSHGCSYCYARPGHEYLGLNAGIDFESKIFVKHRAPELFRAWLARDRWVPETIMFSGVTDCYQPAERRYRLTRGCLEVACEARQPIGMVTKNALVVRDVDVLAEMAAHRTTLVSISITTLDAELARTMEPRTSSPEARLRAIRELTDAGIPTTVLVAPIIPGLNDTEVPAILQAAAEAGALKASFVLLRLPLTVRPVFLDWLVRTQPLRAARVEALIRSTRGGELSDGKFGSRMRGKGPYAEQIGATFRVFAAKHGLDRPTPELDASQFRPPRAASGQRRFF
ncbi:MAG: PA0069 family radical SAM protein [Pirellulales bacterium]|nr:PA0069 family radical SAM protein [Pirellulales bacterium]